MKILVTGGAGYIGSVLVPRLLAAGHQVTVLDNFLYRQSTLLDCCGDSRFQIVRGDCRDEATLRRVLGPAEVILPLAAIVGAPRCVEDATAATSTNLDAIRLLLRLRSPEQRIVFPNTNSGYGIAEGKDFCTEDSPLRPISHYGRTKVEAEAAILADGNAIAFRLATVFGLSPRMRLDLLVNDFVYRAVRDGALVVFQGHFRRNFIHVHDVARAFLHAIDHFESMKDQVYNVGLDDANLTKLELCARIRAQLPRFTYLEAPIGEDPDQRDYLVSNAKLAATGFQPRFSLDHGIDELLKGYEIIRNTCYGNV